MLSHIRVCVLLIYTISCVFITNVDYGFCEEKPVNMNFRNVSVDNVLDFISEATGYIIVKDPSFTEEISIVTPDSCSPDEALNILNSVISVKGFTLIKTGNVVKIIPLENVKKEDIKFSTEKEFFNIEGNHNVITQMLSIKHGNIKEIVAVLTPLVSSFGDVAAYEKNNKILITDSSANIKRLMKIVKEIDIEKQPEAKTKVYNLVYANVEDIAEVIGSLGDKPIVDPKLGKICSAIQGNVKVVLYEKTNTLIITTLNKNFEFISKIIEELDKSLPQVLIEAIILEVTRTNDEKLGIGDASAPGSLTSGFLGSDLGDNLNWKYSLNLSSGTGFSWLGASGTPDPNQYNGFINALFEKENVNVISTPIILTSDKKEATITVGEEIPILKGKTVASDSFQDRPDYDFVYEYQEVGVKLTVVPYINQDDSVFLELHQEVKERTGETLFDAPILQTRRADTSVHVQNGQTIVIGGLIKDNISKKTSKVPLLGDIPLLGYLFKNEKEIKEKVELMVFITPRIIRNNRDMSNASKNRVRKTSNLQEAVVDNDISLEPPVANNDLGSREVTMQDKDSLNLMFPQGYMEQEVEKKTVVGKYQKKKKKNLFDLFKKKGSDKKVDKEIIPAQETFAYKENFSGDHFVDQNIAPTLQEEKVSVKEFKIEPESGEIDLGNVSSEEGYVLKETLYRRGVEFYKKGQYKGAIREFAPIMSIDPKYKRVARYLQICQKRFLEEVGKDMDDAETVAEKQEVVVKNLSTVDKPMNVKKEEILKEKPDYSQNTIFDPQKDAQNVPEDRIDNQSMEKLTGEVIELSSTHDFVVINLGKVNSLSSGMIFRVYRDNELVGKLNVAEVQDHVSGAEIISKISPDFSFGLGDMVVLEG